MAFNPRSEYTIISKDIDIRDFFEYKDEYVTRPPYQRKSVWSKKKKQSLLDSLFRRYYIPRLVIREVRLSDRNVVEEIIDGQQRITTVQEFFNNEISLPNTLIDIDKDLPGKFYKDLDPSIRRFIDKSLKYQADSIKDIDEPHNPKHQMIATEIFWRLQQGETLNYMEIAHAQLSSLTRNFIVKYSDDQAFNYKEYTPINKNKDKLPFFKLLNVDNTRMKHLQFMARFLLLEIGDGPADIGDQKIASFINDAKTADGIDNLTYENTPEAKATIKTLTTFYNIFKDDPMPDSKSGIREFSVEYFIVSSYLLIRHLGKYYVIDEETKQIIKDFIYKFHERWKTFDEATDVELLTFSNRRQQAEKDIEARDIILRKLFFEYLQENNLEILEKDEKRAFSELERIIIYRNDKGLCQQCLRDGIPEKEAYISWSNFQADHVLPHSKGGKTIIENSELLCARHNLSKGAKINN